MQSLFILALTTLVSAFLGAYIAGYLKKKGENLATHEDIGKLVEQVRAVTRTAKEIEAKISSEVWDRQRLWELKREVLFEATKRVAEVDEALSFLRTTLQLIRKESPHDDDPVWATNKADALKKWRKASTAFDETRLFVSVVCGPEARSEFDDLWRLVSAVAAGMIDDPEVYGELRLPLTKALSAVRAIIRKELGIEA